MLDQSTLDVMRDAATWLEYAAQNQYMIDQHYLPDGESMNAAAAKLRALIAAAEPKAPFYACPDCGCTDVQWQSWVYANTGVQVDEAGGECWCDQCQDHFKYVDEVAELKPYSAEHTGEPQS